VFAVRIEIAAYKLLCSHVEHVLEAARGKECGRLALVDPESEKTMLLTAPELFHRAFPSGL